MKYKGTPDEVQFRSDMTVQLYNVMGTEKDICNIARVSLLNDEDQINKSDELTPRDRGLISALMREGHGSPFEHVVFTWGLYVPIFVSRQVVKYRTTSINEQSGRYTEAAPVFYVPDTHNRQMIQMGKTMDYQFRHPRTPDEVEAIDVFDTNLRLNNLQWWREYQDTLRATESGYSIAKEVARMGMPVNMYSKMYVTMNLRSTLHFIAQRIDNPAADRPSHGQYEIGLVAQEMADYIALHYPTVWEAFNDTNWKKL